MIFFLIVDIICKDLTFDFIGILIYYLLIKNKLMHNILFKLINK